MSVFENFLFIGRFSNLFTCYNDILKTLQYKKNLYFQHQIKSTFLNVKS
jgi:hypothetical protein